MLQERCCRNRADTIGRNSMQKHEAVCEPCAEICAECHADAESLPCRAQVAEHCAEAHAVVRADPFAEM